MESEQESTSDTPKGSRTKDTRSLEANLFRELLRVGHDASDDASLSRILPIASLFLSLASGFTTFLGMQEYVHPGAAAFVTIAIQSLLYVACWKIGSSLSARSFSFSTLLIYALTMAVSVFFSYSALLDHVYEAGRRAPDRLRLLTQSAERSFGPAIDSVTNRHSEMGEQVAPRLLQWRNDFDRTIMGPLVLQRTKSSKDQGLVAGLEQDLENERKLGGGYGMRSRSRSTAIAEQKAVAAASEQHTRELETNINSFHSAVTAAALDLDDSKVADATTACEAALAGVGDQRPPSADSLCVEGGDILQTLKEARILDGTIAQVGSDCEFSATSEEELRAQASACLALLPVDGDEKASILAALNEGARYSGSEVHHFELAVGMLMRLHVLAIGSLLVAVSIDGLILLCGFLGAPPTPFLAMRKSSDLDGIEGRMLISLATIAGCEAAEEDPPLLANLKKLLGALVFDFGLDQKKGASGYISAQAIKDLKIDHLVGVVLQRKLGRKTEIKGENAIVLRTRLVLWIADKVVRGDSAQLAYLSAAKRTSRASSGGTDGFWGAANAALGKIYSWLTR